MTLKSVDGQVQHSELSQKKQENLKFKNTPSIVSCPLAVSEKEGVVGDSSNPTPRLSEPLRGIGSTISKTGSFGSSTDHTPFPSRIATMARELRSRQNGRICIPNMAVGFALTEGNKNGTENLLVDHPISKDDQWDIIRPQHTYGEQKSDSGTAGDGRNSEGIQKSDSGTSGNGGNSEGMIVDRFEPRGGGKSLMIQMNRSEGQDKSNGCSLHQNNPNLYGRGTAMSDHDESQLETANGLTNIEGEKRRTDLGLEMADC